MTKKLLVSFAAAALLTAGGAWAQQELGDQLAEACKTDIENYCIEVTPRDGRLLACAYAHQDKLSARCEYALYDAAAQLEQFAATVTHLARQCHADLLEHCGEVEIGEGRVGTCLLVHELELSHDCRQAIDEVGLETVED